MRKEFGQIEGDMQVTDHLALYGLCTGDIVVEEGGELHLYGLCAGNVDVKDRGCMVLYGMVTGNVVNSGGRIEVGGMIVGNLEDNGGNTTVLPTAKVGMAP